MVCDGTGTLSKGDCRVFKHHPSLGDIRAPAPVSGNVTFPPASRVLEFSRIPNARLARAKPPNSATSHSFHFFLF